MIDGLLLTELAIIPTPGGSVRHALKASAAGFAGFGEAYFSEIESGAVKAWKRHTRMVCNLLGVNGRICVQLLDLRPDSPTHGESARYLLGTEHYQRLTIPAGVWFGFAGVADGASLLLNVASIEHDPQEAESAALDDPRFAGLSWT